MNGAPPRVLAKRPALAVLVAISTLQPFAVNVLAPATPRLARVLETDYATVQLTLTLYLVAVAVTQLVVGPISDRFGRRPCILVGIGLFAVGSLLGALAGGIEMLLFARVVQAMGGGTCFALARAVVRDTASKDESASLIGYIAMAMVVAPMVAPLVGGFLDAQFGWRSIFVATLVLTTVVGVAALLLLGETAPPGAAGSLAEILGAFPVLLRDRVFLGYTVALAATTTGFFVFVAGAPYVVVDVMGREPQVYALYFVLTAGGYMVGNFVSGRFGQRLGSDRLARIGLQLQIASILFELAVLSLLPWTPATLFWPLILNSIGNGLTIPGGTAAVLSVRPELAGTAAGVLGALQLGVGALGTVAVSYAVPLWPPALVVMMLGLVLVAWVALSLAQRAPRA